MKRFLPLVTLLVLLLLTVAATVFLAGKYDRIDPALEFNMRHRYILGLKRQVIQFIQTGKLDLAERLVRKIIIAMPSQIGAVKMLGKICYLKGDLLQSERIYRKLMIQNPDDPVVRNNLGEVLVAQGLYHAGIRELAAAERISGGARYIQYNLCRAYILNKNYTAAEQYYQLAYRFSEDERISRLPAEALTGMPEFRTVQR